MLVTANEVPAKSELDKPSTGQSYHRPSARAGDRCVEFDAAPRDSSSNFCRRLERVVLKCAVLRRGRSLGPGLSWNRDQQRIRWIDACRLVRQRSAVDRGSPPIAPRLGILDH